MKLPDPDLRSLCRVFADAVVSEDAPLNRVMLVSPRRAVEVTYPDGRREAHYEPEDRWLLRCGVIVLAADRHGDDDG